MKAKKTSSDKMAVIKAGLIFSWAIVLFVANFQNWLIEAYLISIGIGLVGFLVFDKKLHLRNRLVSNNELHHNNGPQGEKYLNIFF